VKKTLPTITVVIPTLNEAGGIGKVVKDCFAFANEVIVVDANSKDGTGEIARENGAKVIIEPRRGYGLAFMRGFLAASSEIIATTDGDGTYPVDEIATIAQRLVDENLKFISCNRFPLKDKSSMFFRNQFGNKALTVVGSVLWAHAFQDILSGMWVFRRSALNELELYSPSWNFSQEIKLEARSHFGKEFQEHHISYHERVGVSKLVPWKVGLQNLSYFFIQRAGLRTFMHGNRVKADV
jgi:glycosyltransferase involved in cell wall biosynthesis